jgi:hypothetical protein
MTCFIKSMRHLFRISPLCGSVAGIKAMERWPNLMPPPARGAVPLHRPGWQPADVGRAALLKVRGCPPRPGTSLAPDGRVEAVAPGALAGTDAWPQQRLLALAIMLSITVLQRFALPVAGSVFGLGFLICLAATLVGLMQGVLRIDPQRAVLYGLALAAMFSTLLFKENRFSLLSLAMLVTLYAPFVAVLTVTSKDYLRLLNLFQRLIAFVAWCGLIQFGVQFLLSPGWMFPFDRLLPEALFIPNYHLEIPFYGSHLKSTGLWFLEPSIFSQALAFGMLIELAFFRRLSRIVLYGCAYITSFSGTGALLLLLMAPMILLRNRSVGLIALAVVALAALLLFRNLPMLAPFFERTAEFGNIQSSGSMRMIAPYWAVRDVVLNEPRLLLFGLGPGQWGTGMNQLDYIVLDSGWLKLLFEYGLIGTVPFLIFYLHCLFAASPDRLLSLACLLQFAFLGGYLNAFFVGFLHMILVVWPRLSSMPVRRALLTPAGGIGEPGLAASAGGGIRP